jgi:RNA polymerase sigma factor (sigma-70 family)
MTADDWYQIVFSELVFGRLEAMCEQDLASTGYATEALSYLIQKLSENNWERCLKFEAKDNAKPETFIHSIAKRLIIDFRREKEGRPRPPSWLKAQGQLWVDLWHDICLRRHAVESVVDEYHEKKCSDRNIVRQTIQVIKARLPWCGVSSNPIDDQYDVHDGVDHAETDSEPDTQLARQHQEHGLMLLNLFLHPDQTGPDETWIKLVDDAVDELEVTIEDRLLLQMHFTDGLSHAAIAEKLNLQKHQVTRQIKRILSGLRSLLADADLDP